MSLLIITVWESVDGRAVSHLNDFVNFCALDIVRVAYLVLPSAGTYICRRCSD